MKWIEEKIKSINEEIKKISEMNLPCQRKKID